MKLRRRIGQRYDGKRNCEGCGLPLLWEHAYRIVGKPGVFCSMGCIETAIVGLEHCRWCGNDMKESYTSVDSRLCSEDCSTNYYAHVLGDKTAALGTGRRFLFWLQKHFPSDYQELLQDCQEALKERTAGGGGARLTPK